MARVELASLAVMALVTAGTVGCGRVGYELATGSGAGINLGTSGSDGRDSRASATGGNAPWDASSPGNGGSGIGGAVSTGGVMAAGGAVAAGGAGGSGGGVATGGTIGTDGSVATGGTTGSGGTTPDGGSDGCVVTNGGIETCDGVDNDCSGGIDEGAVCGSQCTGASYGGHAYAFCSSPLPFADAAAECQAKSMRLARIDDAQENQFLAGIAFAATGTANNTTIWPWFGAHSVATPVQWVFMDGTVFWSGRSSGSAVGGLYSNWASASPGDPTGTYCATLSHSGTLTWVDRGCSNAQPYLCESY